ncbi:MAG TPA: hypothetical protein VND64_18085 [Pirellulales bacterium]|nr:hypothetical protein [Pirellulales bacterium]
MMPNELLNALTAVAERLVSLAAEDDQVRAEVRRLAQALLAATDEAPLEAESASTVCCASFSPAEPITIAAPEVCESGATPAPQEAVDVHAEELLPLLTLGQMPSVSEPPAISLPVRWTAVTDTDLAQIEARCHLKAEGARWASTRHRRIANGADFSTEIAPGDRAIIAKARNLPDCLLWMCRLNSPSPADTRLYDDVAGCYEAVARALAVLKLMHGEPDLQHGEFERSLALLAEAQSALRVAIVEIEGPVDPDQLRVFTWLKATTSENRVFVERYMRADDPADPTAWADLSSRIEAVDARVQETFRRIKQRRKLLGKVRHKLQLIARAPEDAREHWRILAASVDELVRDGLPPSNRELRELLAPALEGMPDLEDQPRGFQLVLRELDRFLAASPSTNSPTVLRTTAEVQAASRLLEGRSVVLIGGERRPIAEQSLKDAFGLRELFWITTREHESNDGFEPYIARPDVAVVLLAIRWSSHSYGDVRVFCERHGRPLVRLPAGYNANQVASQILEQCSERLQRA